jgi:hypothetical protein
MRSTSWVVVRARMTQGSGLDPPRRCKHGTPAGAIRRPAQAGRAPASRGVGRFLYPFSGDKSPHPVRGRTRAAGFCGRLAVARSAPGAPRRPVRAPTQPPAAGGAARPALARRRARASQGPDRAPSRRDGGPGRSIRMETPTGPSPRVPSRSGRRHLRTHPRGTGCRRCLGSSTFVFAGADMRSRADTGSHRVAPTARRARGGDRTMGKADPRLFRLRRQ